MTITEIKEQAWQCAKKRKVYGADPETAIIDKLKEEIEELRFAFLKNKDADINYYDYYVNLMTQPQKIPFEYYIKNSKGDELADIIIVCLAAARELGIDIETHLKLKLEYNNGRDD